MSETETSSPHLVRGVSRWELVGLSLNGVIGSGIYLLPAAAAALLGATSIWAIVLAGLATSLMVLCFAEASSYFDQPGGAYLYTREAFGDLIGFEVGWMTWLTRIAATAALANGFALALGHLLPAAADGALFLAAVTLPLLLLAALNLIGVKVGARLSALLMVVKLVPLVVFIAFGFWHVDWSRIGDFEAPRPGAMAQAALLLLFAYAGFENTPAAAGEYRQPQRDTPFALLTTIAVVTVVYALIQIVAFGTLPALAEADSPLAAAASVFLGPWGLWLLGIGAAVSVLGTLSNSVFFGPRYLYALAEDGYGPRALGALHPRFRTPHLAILLGTLLALALASTGTFVGLAMLSAIARLATIAGTAAAVPVLRRRYGGRPGAFVLPGGPVIPILALGIAAGFIASASLGNLLAGAVALAVGALIYRLRRASRLSRQIAA
jgi:basic amino acid/polyamine antiporter, APA family